jgi:phosphoserine phosphatase
MTIKLVIFDVDGTILQSYSWQFIHEELGTWGVAKRFADQFLEGKITYEKWAELDAALWRGQTLERIREIIKKMPYTMGAKETIAAFKARGVKTYLLSAGLSQVAERVQDETETDGYMANTLLVRNGLLTGEVDVNVSFYGKDKLLPRILPEFHVALSECAAVGDDPTLVPLFRKVVLGIAFHPVNENVRKNAHVTIEEKDLRSILPYLTVTSKGTSSS